MSLIRRFVNLFHRSKLDEDIDAELRSHIEMRTADNIAAGMSPKDARRDALLRFGSRAALKERVIAADAHMFLDSLWQDLRYGLRMLRKSPGFTAVAILTLALGIGATTAIFSVVNSILFEAFPYSYPGRLVVLMETMPPQMPMVSVNLPDFFDWRTEQNVFEEIAAFSPDNYALTGWGSAKSVPVMHATANLFSVLGVKPYLGRFYTAAEDRAGGPDLAVVSYGFWQKELGGNRNCIGQTIVLGMRPYTVVGVLPRTFDFAPGYYAFGPSVWLSMGRIYSNKELMRRGPHEGFEALARLKVGVTLQQARGEMTVIARRLSLKYSGSNQHTGVSVESFRSAVVGSARQGLLALLGAVGFLLLIACINVSGLLLARGAGRRREFAVRMALGAGRLRIARQTLAESLPLGIVGGGAGLLLTLWLNRVANSHLPTDIARAPNITVDATVLLFAFAVSLLSALVAGTLPALQAVRLTPAESMKGVERGTGRGFAGKTPRRGMVAFEAALATVLVIGSGLLLRSFIRLRSVNPGFDPAHVLTLQVSLDEARYGSGHAAVEFFHEAVERIRELPGVETVGTAYPLPFSQSGWFEYVAGVDGRKLQHQLPYDFAIVSPAYFKTMGIALVKGRDFTQQDNAQAQRVAMIDQSMARSLFPEATAVGHTIQTRGQSFQVVGVVAHVTEESLSGEMRPQFYVPFDQVDQADNYIAVRTAVTIQNPLSLTQEVRAAIQGLDPDQPVTSARTMRERVAASLAARRISLWLTQAFGALALLLVSIGLYGTLSFWTLQRTQEIGIRIALGAQPRDLLFSVVSQGLRLVGAGAIAGVLASLLLNRAIAGFLYDVKPTDPIALAVALGTLAAAGFISSYIPARRAMKVDPMVALRYE